MRQPADLLYLSCHGLVRQLASLRVHDFLSGSLRHCSGSDPERSASPLGHPVVPVSGRAPPRRVRVARPSHRVSLAGSGLCHDIAAPGRCHYIGDVALLQAIADPLRLGWLVRRRRRGRDEGSNACLPCCARFQPVGCRDSSFPVRSAALCRPSRDSLDLRSLACAVPGVDRRYRRLSAIVLRCMV